MPGVLRDLPRLGRAARRGLVLVWAVAAWGGAQAGCEAGRQADLPVVAFVEREPVALALRFKVQVVEHQKPFAAFKLSASSPEDQGFVALIDGLKDADLARLQPLVRQVHEMAEAQGVREFAELWRSSFDLSTLRVLLKACVNGHHLFLWQVDTAKGPNVRQFTWLPERARDDSAKRQALTVGRLLRSSLQLTAEGKAAAVSDVATAAAAAKTYVLRPKDEPRQAAGITVSAVGKVTALRELPNALAASRRSDTLLGVVDGALRASRQGDVTAVNALYSAASSAKYTRWWQKMPGEEQRAFSASVDDSVLLAEVDAGPLRYFYYAEGASAAAARDILGRHARREIGRDEAMAAFANVKLSLIQVARRGAEPPRVVNLWSEDFAYDFLTDRDGFLKHAVLAEVLDQASRN